MELNHFEIVTSENMLRYGFIYGEWKVFLSTHACERAEERLSELGIRFENKTEYSVLALNFLNNMVTDDLVTRYILGTKRPEKMLFKDCRTKMCFVLKIDPIEKEVKCITFGTERNEKWVHGRNKDKIAWLYPEAFVFMTKYGGNITWPR